MQLDILTNFLNFLLTYNYILTLKIIIEVLLQPLAKSLVDVTTFNALTILVNDLLKISIRLITKDGQKSIKKDTHENAIIVAQKAYLSGTIDKIVYNIFNGIHWREDRINLLSKKHDIATCHICGSYRKYSMAVNNYFFYDEDTGLLTDKLLALLLSMYKADLMISYQELLNDTVVLFPDYIKGSYHQLLPKIADIENMRQIVNENINLVYASNSFNDIWTKRALLILHGKVQLSPKEIVGDDAQSVPELTGFLNEIVGINECQTNECLTTMQALVNTLGDMATSIFKSFGANVMSTKAVSLYENLDEVISEYRHVAIYQDEVIYIDVPYSQLRGYTPVARVVKASVFYFIVILFGLGQVIGITILGAKLWNPFDNDGVVNFKGILLKNRIYTATGSASILVNIILLTYKEWLISSALKHYYDIMTMQWTIPHPVNGDAVKFESLNKKWLFHHLYVIFHHIFSDYKEPSVTYVPFHNHDELILPYSCISLSYQRGMENGGIKLSVGKTTGHIKLGDENRAIFDYVMTIYTMIIKWRSLKVAYIGYDRNPLSRRSSRSGHG